MERSTMTIVRDSFYINGEWVKASSAETFEVTIVRHRRTLRHRSGRHRRRSQ